MAEQFDPTLFTTWPPGLEVRDYRNGSLDFEVSGYMMDSYEPVSAGTTCRVDQVKELIQVLSAWVAQHSDRYPEEADDARTK